MASYSFSLESFNPLAVRSKDGHDDLWLIAAMGVGGRGSSAAWPVGTGVEAGQGFTGPWSAGPYQVAVGESGVAAYTLVNLGGSSPEDQDKIVRQLADSITTAVIAAAGVAAPTEAAIRRVFGGSGELLSAPALGPGVVDCRGLVGLYVAPFTAANAPAEEELETSAPIALTGTSPAPCGTTPQGTAVFSVRRGPSLFGQSTPVTALASAPASMELFAVGMDGLVRYNVRTGTGAFGAWQVVGRRTFSQSAPLIALNGAQRRDVLATGTDGILYQGRWTPAEGWADWLAVSAPGQFLPDTPVSALWVGAVLTLFAVDPDGVVQSISWKDNAIVNPWAPLPGLVLARKTAVTVMSWTAPWIEVYAVSSVGVDYHTSRPLTAPAWGPWQAVGGGTAVSAPLASTYLGTTFEVFVQPGVRQTVGMLTFRVDGAGILNELGWTGQTSWLPRRFFSGLKTFWAGSVCGVKVASELRVYVVDAQTKRVGQSTWTMQFATPVGNTAASWSAWQLLPPGPALGSDSKLASVSLDDAHAELFVVDRDGVVQHLPWTAAGAWGQWSVV